MTVFGGIDLGGTKIEARAFDTSMTEIARKRIVTPTDSYSQMLDALQSQVSWLETQGDVASIGLGTPGLINPQSGVMLTSNLPASGEKLGDDLTARTGRRIHLINDCRAAALAEAMTGAARDGRNVIGLNLGTGVAGGHVINGVGVPDANGQHAEYGHLPLPADVSAIYGLPQLPCGCGLTGCYETFLGGAGLARLAKHLHNIDATPEEVMDNPEFAEAKTAWVTLAASLISVIARTSDPDTIVLYGGLGMRPELPKALYAALSDRLLAGTQPPRIVQAQHGDASGALGAALFARSREEAEQ